MLKSKIKFKAHVIYSILSLHSLKCAKYETCAKLYMVHISYASHAFSFVTSAYNLSIQLLVHVLYVSLNCDLANVYSMKSS